MHYYILRYYIYYIIIATEQKRKLLTSQPNFESSTTFSDNLEAIEMRKTYILMNKPIAIGQDILVKSKELMYTFWYDIIKPIYKDKVNVYGYRQFYYSH